MQLPTTIIVLLAVGTLSVAAGKIFTCNDTLQILTGDRGLLIIDRAVGSCIVQAKEGSKFFGLGTGHLNLYDGESVIVTPGKASEKQFTIDGPVVSDYLVFGMVEVKLEFKLNKTNEAGTDMILDYFQGENSIPIDVDKASEMTIMSFNTNSYNLAFSKNIPDPVHLQISGSNDLFGHHLMESKLKNIAIQESDKNTVVVKTSAVRSDCSKSYADKLQESHEISGPDATNIHGKYKCVSLFSTSQVGQAHYDVDFANFLDIVDDKDELTIDDGVQALKINRYTAARYYQMKPILSFKGQKLAVLYDSPQVVKPRGVFKLAVNAKTTGGVVDQYQDLSLTSSGKVRYTLRQQGSDGISALDITGVLAKTNLSLSDDLNNVIRLNGDIFVPSVIAVNQAGKDTILELDLTGKVGAKVSYRRENSCSGTIFGSSGTISISNVVGTCYWLIGSKATLSIDYHNLQQTNSCLEIYSLQQQKPVFKRCNIGVTEVLPSFSLGPSYLVIKTASNASTFQASISQTVGGSVRASKGLQTQFNSIGYPTFYLWSSDSEKTAYDARNKSVVLSVADFDIRAGEKLTVGTDEISNTTKFKIGDIDISNKLVDISIARSLSTNDFDAHRGYSLVASQFQAIISADMSKASIQTPKNLTSLLLRVSAAQANRLAYNISNTTTTASNQNYVMHVIDARSVAGRKVYDDERFNGSTTSNMLLLRFVTSQNGTTLPEFKIAYKQLACNKTVDHVCDQATRCVPVDKLCKGRSYCSDGSDLKVACASGPAPQPQIIEKGGYTGVTVFILSVLMFSLGIVATLYGPDLYKNAENRFRSGQYTTFTSTE